MQKGTIYSTVALHLSLSQLWASLIAWVFDCLSRPRGVNQDIHDGQPCQLLCSHVWAPHDMNACTLHGLLQRMWPGGRQALQLISARIWRRGWVCACGRKRGEEKGRVRNGIKWKRRERGARKEKCTACSRRHHFCSETMQFGRC